MKENCRGGGFLSLSFHHCRAGPNAVLCLFLFSPPHRARSGARRRQRRVPGGCRPLPLGHPPGSPPPRLLIRERRVPGGLAAPLPHRGLGRRAARGLLSTGRAMHRRTGGGAERPRMAPSPTCRDRSRRRFRCTDPTTCHQTVTRHHGPGGVAAPWPALGARSRRGGCRPEPSPGCPSRRLTKPPMPKKTPRLKPPGSAFSPLGPECQFSSPKLLPKHPDVARPPSPASAPDRILSGPLGEGHPTQPAVLQGSRTSHYSLFQLTLYPCASH